MPRIPSYADAIARAWAATPVPSRATGTRWDHSRSNPPAVPDPAPDRQDRWMAADEWMSQFLRRVSEPRSRGFRQARTELLERPWDARIRFAAEYDAETEQLRRFIRQNGFVSGEAMTNLCPECRDGKPWNCTGWTLDPDDNEVPCEGATA